MKELRKALTQEMDQSKQLLVEQFQDQLEVLREGTLGQFGKTHSQFEGCLDDIFERVKLLEDSHKTGMGRIHEESDSLN